MAHSNWKIIHSAWNNNLMMDTIFG